MSATIQALRHAATKIVATVTADGRPNLSPKGTTTIWDDEHLVFADLASPGTVANLATNPAVEVNVVDPILRKGYRFKGNAVVHTRGDQFERGLRILRERGFSASPDRVRMPVAVISAIPSAISSTLGLVSVGYHSSVSMIRLQPISSVGVTLRRSSGSAIALSMRRFEICLNSFSSQRCLVIPASELKPLLLGRPSVAYRMLQAEARRLRAANIWPG